jgi:hypothetical protein
MLSGAYSDAAMLKNGKFDADTAKSYISSHIKGEDLSSIKDEKSYRAKIEEMN